MEEILRSIRSKTKADRAVIYQMKPGPSMASGACSYKMSPCGISSGKKAQKKVPDLKILSKEYPYHLFMELLRKTFSYGEVYFSRKSPTSLKNTETSILLKAMDDLKVERFINFAISETSFLCLHWCTDSPVAFLISRQQIAQEISQLQRVMNTNIYW